MEIDVKVTPRARKPRVEVVGAETVHVWVSEPPADGQANGAVVEALAKALGIPKSQVEIVRGHSSRQKRVKLPDAAAEILAARIQQEGLF